MTDLYTIRVLLFVFLSLVTWRVMLAAIRRY